MADPIFAAPITNPFGFPKGQGYLDAAFGDIDNDGDFDLFTNGEDGITRYYQNTGSATAPVFAAPVANPFGLPDIGLIATIALADLNNDGKLDVFLQSYVANGVINYFQNTGTASSPAFGTGTAVASTGDFFPATPTFGDIDNDGDLDLFVGHENGNFRYFQNTGTASAPVFAPVVINPFGLTDAGDITKPTLGDIDNDGDLDLLVGETDNNFLNYFENTGTASTPAFAPLSTNPFGLIPGSYPEPNLVDIDNDGDLDVFDAQIGGALRFFRNDLIPPPNTDPTAVNNSFSTNENTVLTVNTVAGGLLGNDSDPDGNPLTITAVNGVTVNVGSPIVLGNGKLTVNANGTLNFDPTNGTATLSDGYDYLAQGATATESFTYTISDGKGGTDSATVGITITGVNNTASISGTSTGDVTEDTTTPDLTTGGTLTIADVDKDENIFQTTVSSAAGNLGSLTITAAGDWAYSVANTDVQYLRKDETKIETFTVTSADGTAQNIQITIQGASDAASIGGVTTNSVTEDTPIGATTLVAQGQLSILDADQGEGAFSTTVTSAAGNLGTLVIDATGAYQYEVENTDIQNFGANDQTLETFTVTSTDGTSQDIKITVQGANDVPIAGNDTFKATKGRLLTLSLPTLLRNDTDVDQGDTLSITAVGNAVKGEVTLKNDSVTFKPTNSGTGGFRYTLSDAQGTTTNGTVALSIGRRRKGDDSSDVIIGSNRNDKITGDGGSDRIEGRSGDDQLDGRRGDDILIGEEGADSLLGRLGADTLRGGGESDTFIVAKLEESLLNTVDRILDLGIGLDVIDVPKAVNVASVVQVGKVRKLTEPKISAKLTTRSFKADDAGIFTVGDRTFIALNDAKAGFSASSDAVIEITGYSGNLNQLEIV